MYSLKGKAHAMQLGRHPPQVLAALGRAWKEVPHMRSEQYVLQQPGALWRQDVAGE